MKLEEEDEKLDSEGKTQVGISPAFLFASGPALGAFPWHFPISASAVFFQLPSSHSLRMSSIEEVTSCLTGSLTALLLSIPWRLSDSSSATSGASSRAQLEGILTIRRTLAPRNIATAE